MRWAVYTCHHMTDFFIILSQTKIDLPLILSLICFSFFHCVNQTKSISPLSHHKPLPSHYGTLTPTNLSLSLCPFDPNSLLSKPLPLPLSSFLHKRFHPLFYIIRVGISNFNLIRSYELVACDGDLEWTQMWFRLQVIRRWKLWRKCDL